MSDRPTEPRHFYAGRAGPSAPGSGSTASVSIAVCSAAEQQHSRSEPVCPLLIATITIPTSSLRLFFAPRTFTLQRIARFSTFVRTAKMAEHKPYMVIFKDGTPQSAIDGHKSKVQQAGGTIKQTFDSSIMRGFAATLPDSFAQELTTASVGGKHEHIEYVEPDSEVKTL